MGRIGFTMEADPERTSRAMGYELHISPKHAREISVELRERGLTEAKRILEEVAEQRRAIPMRRFKRDVGHRPGGVGPGRYPVHAAREILRVLRDAEGNATYKGLNPESMIISHIAAKRGRILHGFTPRAHGGFSAKNVETVSVEIILEEREEKSESE
ncbi:MAG: 50S ribosomal protein L22 [Euryarchaeota archaeon]|nr:50S ribosomal protein L22 [Euryarchaeota archaeon]